MSKTVDRQRAVQSEQQRCRRMSQMFTDLARVYRLREEGMSMDDIATRLGWSRATLYNWLEAAKLLERLGIRMAEGKTQ